MKQGVTGTGTMYIVNVVKKPSTKENSSFFEHFTYCILKGIIDKSERNIFTIINVSYM